MERNFSFVRHYIEYSESSRQSRLCCKVVFVEGQRGAEWAILIRATLESKLRHVIEVDLDNVRPTLTIVTVGLATMTWVFYASIFINLIHFDKFCTGCIWNQCNYVMRHVVVNEFIKGFNMGSDMENANSRKPERLTRKWLSVNTKVLDKIWKDSRSYQGIHQIC